MVRRVVAPLVALVCVAPPAAFARSSDLRDTPQVGLLTPDRLDHPRSPDAATPRFSIERHFDTPVFANAV